MSREDIVAVASRLFAVYVLLNIAQSVPGAIQMLAQESGKGWVALHVLTLILGLLVCFLLWFFPLSVARKLLPVMREPKSEQSIDSSVAFSLGLTLIGIWVFANAVIDFSFWLTLFIRSKQITESYFEWSHEQIANMVATVTELIVSVWLLFGSTGIKRFIYKYRYGGDT